MVEYLGMSEEDKSKPILSINQLNVIIDMLTEGPSEESIQIYLTDPLVNNMSNLIVNLWEKKKGEKMSAVYQKLDRKIDFQATVCRGSLLLGTACMECSKCEEELNEIINDYNKIKNRVIEIDLSVLSQLYEVRNIISNLICNRTINSTEAFRAVVLLDDFLKERSSVEVRDVKGGDNENGFD